MGLAEAPAGRKAFGESPGHPRARAERGRAGPAARFRSSSGLTSLSRSPHLPPVALLPLERRLLTGRCEKRPCTRAHGAGTGGYRQRRARVLTESDKERTRVRSAHHRAHGSPADERVKRFAEELADLDSEEWEFAIFFMEIINRVVAEKAEKKALAEFSELTAARRLPTRPHDGGDRPRRLRKHGRSDGAEGDHGRGVGARGDRPRPNRTAGAGSMRSIGASGTRLHRPAKSSHSRRKTTSRL